VTSEARYRRKDKGRSRRGRRSKQLLEDFKKKRRQWNVKEEALDFTKRCYFLSTSEDSRGGFWTKYLVYLNLKLKTECSSIMSICIYQTTRRYISEHSNHNNLKEQLEHRAHRASNGIFSL